MAYLDFEDIWDDENLRPELARRILVNVAIVQGYSNDILAMISTKTEDKKKRTIRNYLRK